MTLTPTQPNMIEIDPFSRFSLYFPYISPNFDRALQLSYTALYLYIYRVDS